MCKPFRKKGPLLLLLQVVFLLALEEKHARDGCKRSGHRPASGNGETSDEKTNGE